MPTPAFVTSTYSKGSAFEANHLYDEPVSALAEIQLVCVEHEYLPVISHQFPCSVNNVATVVKLAW